ncbi:MAG TPA: hypothetical protein VHW09_15725 [Bryobacteraceae bacterium]|jgi:hypothetical protein|nr:hypothetical protein [Bryobacteraceae bacterium]
MFRVIQIDPETLAIHLNAGAISNHSRGKDFFNFIDAAHVNGVLDPLLAACEANDLDLVSFGTSFLHELRHFGDLLLTPFGFYRIRTAFEFFINLPHLIFSNEQIPVPLMSGMDPITRSAIGIGNAFERSEAYRMGLTAFSRVRLINAENHYDPTENAIKCGGDRIIEALAYITQFEFLFQRCDSPDTRRRFSTFFSPFTASEFDLAYRWFIPDCHRMHPGEVMPNNRLMTAILFASLCGSIPIHAPFRTKSSPKSVRKPPVKYRDVSEKLPSERYYRLAEYFKNTPRPSIEDPHEAIELVDTACKNLFGLSINAEIEEDLEFSRRFAKDLSSINQHLTGLDAQLNPAPLFSELVRYREFLYSGFRKYALTFSTAQGFFEHTAEVLKPSLIYHDLAGRSISSGIGYSRLPDEWIGLIDRRLEPPAKSLMFPQPMVVIYASWSPLPGDNGSTSEHLSAVTEPDKPGIGFLNNRLLASRQGVYGILAPFYRWILYGNKYRGISEVENDGLAAALHLNKDKFVIDPFYEDSEDISLPDAFWEFFGRAENVCDICGAAVTKDDSYIVSARTMRQNAKIVEFYRALGNDCEFQFLKRDWSEWLVCRLDMERFGFPIPHREAPNG